MKQINVYFDDKEYNDLIKVKGDMSWHDFILFMLNKLKEVKK